MSIDAARFAAAVLQWEGAPYHHQGRNIYGLDCVGLAIVALAEQGIVIDAPANYSAAAQGDSLVHGIEESGLCIAAPTDLNSAEPGDILVFRIRRDPQHVAIYLGNGRMIHAAQGVGVCIVTLSPLWRSRLVARYQWRS